MVLAIAIMEYDGLSDRFWEKYRLSLGKFRENWHNR
jgi:hypothetical protein